MQEIEFSAIINASFDSVLDGLSSPKILKRWLCNEIVQTENQDTYVIQGKSTLSNWTFSLLTIKISSSRLVIWTWNLVDLGLLSIEFRLENSQKGCKLTICHFAEFSTSLIHYAEDWLIALANLKFYLESGEEMPRIDYTAEIDIPMSVSIMIKAPASKIFQTLTNPHDLEKMTFAEFAEIDLNKFIYTYGWIGEGPSNLLRIIENKELVHDWFYHYEPMGTIRWIIIPKLANDQECEVIVRHLQLDLEGENNPQYTFQTYRHGWIHKLQQLKMYVEQGIVNVNLDHKENYIHLM